MADPYFSEIKYRGGAANDFAEVAVDTGISVANIQVVIYHPNGNVRSTNNLGTLVGTISGKDVYVVSAGIHKNGAVALVQNGTVLSFVSFDKAVSTTKGPAAGTSSTQIGSTGNNSNASLVNDGTGTYSIQTPPDSGVIPCFLEGTRIQTENGLRRVETLEIGDRIKRFGAGYTTLKWAGSVQLSPRSGDTGHSPICIPKGALGQGMPERDLWVSSNHRILMTSPEYELYFSNSEVFIPAKHLLGWRGVSVDLSITKPVYHHLLFDKHEVIVAEGVATESFHPGDTVLEGMDEDTLFELLTLFPELAEEFNGYGKTARTCLRSYESDLALEINLAKGQNDTPIESATAVIR